MLTRADPYDVIELERFFIDPEGEDLIYTPYCGVVCRNLRYSLRKIGYKVSEGNQYDQELEDAVLQLQVDNDHVNQDGIFGPLTRRLLATILVQRLQSGANEQLLEPAGKKPVSVFLSYAWKDSALVNKIDQWLRDRGIIVRRDNRDFQPGLQLSELIENAVTGVDKILVVLSKNSKFRDWPLFERSLAESREKQEAGSFLIYLVLDDSKLPKHDDRRIAVMASGKRLKQVGEELLHGITGKKPEKPKYNYNEEEIL